MCHKVIVKSITVCLLSFKFDFYSEFICNKPYPFSVYDDDYGYNPLVRFDIDFILFNHIS